MVFDKISTKLKILDFRRLRWFFWIFLSSLFALLFFYLKRDVIFYDTITSGLNNIYRFFWVLPFSFLGFSFLALLAAKDGGVKDDSPWSSYIFYYFPRLIAFSLIIFSVLHLFESTSTYIYYFFSAGLGLYLGYNIDWIKLEDIFRKSR